MNVVTRIAQEHGRSYITPGDVSAALGTSEVGDVRLAVLDVLGNQTGFGAEDGGLCAFLAAQGDPAARGSRPPVVCLIGSTKFFRAFQQAAYEAELAGKITVGPAFTPAVGPDEHGGTVGITPEQKIAVDEAFVHKIAMADEVLVINVGGYVGSSTRRDIANARALGKPVRWLEPQHAFGSA